MLLRALPTTFRGTANEEEQPPLSIYVLLFLSVTLAFWHGIFSSSNTQFQTLTMVWVMMIIMIFLTVVFSYFCECVYKKYVLSIQRELIEECKIDKKNADHINFGGAKKHNEIDKAFSFFFLNNDDAFLTLESSNNARRVELLEHRLYQ